jgi:hypothetical protein
VNSHNIVVTVRFRLFNLGSSLERVDGPFWGRRHGLLSAEQATFDPHAGPGFHLCLITVLLFAPAVLRHEFQRQRVGGKKAWRIEYAARTGFRSA